MTTKVLMELDDDLHARFKALCAIKKQRMQDMLPVVIKEYVDKWQVEQQVLNG